MKKNFTHRLATKDDIPAIKEIMDRSILELQKGFLTEEQIKVSHEYMGLDYGLIEDQTYFVILHGEGTDDEVIVGCGGWGKRKTLYGGSHSKGRNEELLDPKVDRARIRAMYCHPDWARNGIGRLIMNICESAAQDAGFSKMTMGATLAGRPLYEACGYHVVEHGNDKAEDGTQIPVLTMNKDL